jgi:hypothetical protein
MELFNAANTYILHINPVGVLNDAQLEPIVRHMWELRQAFIVKDVREW